MRTLARSLHGVHLGKEANPALLNISMGHPGACIIPAVIDNLGKRQGTWKQIPREQVDLQRTIGYKVMEQAFGYFLYAVNQLALFCLDLEESVVEGDWQDSNIQIDSVESNTAIDDGMYHFITLEIHIMIKSTQC